MSDLGHYVELYIVGSIFSEAARPTRCHDGNDSGPRRSTKNALD
jgi:hypothetical protein